MTEQFIFSKGNRFLDSDVGRAILHLMVKRAKNSGDVLEIFGLKPVEDDHLNHFNVEVKINGVEVQFSELIDNLYNQMDYLVKRKAKTLFKEKYNENIRKLYNLTSDVQSFMKSKHPEMFDDE